MNNNSIFIVAGGSSLKEFDFNKLKDKITIVSNKSFLDVPNANFFITTDITFLNYLKKYNLYNRWKLTPSKKIFVVNLIASFMQLKNGKITDTRYNLTYNLTDFNQIIICRSAKDVGYNFDNFHSGYNSGFCAFQYTIIKKFKKIYLLGMDMCSTEETHYHGGYGRSVEKFNKNLSNYYPHFAEVLKKLNKERPDIKIISCSKTSRLNKFIEYKDIEEILK